MNLLSFARALVSVDVRLFVCVCARACVSVFNIFPNCMCHQLILKKPMNENSQAHLLVFLLFTLSLLFTLIKQ